MHLVTSRFGPIDIDDDGVIAFTQPIIGFPALRRYAILPGPPGSSVQWLQSVDAGETAFLIMNPGLVYPEYKATLSPGELMELGVSAATELDVYTLVVVPQDRTQIRTNLKAPILINAAKRLGKQTILEHSGYPIQFFLAQQPQPAAQEAEQPKEAAHAGTDA